MCTYLKNPSLYVLCFQHPLSSPAPYLEVLLLLALATGRGQVTHGADDCKLVGHSQTRHTIKSKLQGLGCLFLCFLPSSSIYIIVL